MPKLGRLSSRRVQEILRRGRSIRTPLFTLRYLKDHKVPGRALSVVVSKRVAKSAVERNTLKRRCREIVRKVVFTTPPPCGLVLSLDPRAQTSTFQELLNTLTQALGRIEK